MSSAPKLELRDFQDARHRGLDSYLAELRIYLAGLPAPDVERFLEETADHLEMLLEEFAEDEGRLAAEFGTPRELADQFIEAWYTKRSRLSPLERIFGPGNLSVVALFGFSAVLYWALLQFRVFLPSNSAYHLPWSPGEIRKYFPEPLPFPDFSLQFLVMTGVPLLTPPIMGWIVGRIVPVRPQAAVYSVMMPMILISYVIGILLLPVTDGLIFAVVQSVYWLPVGCLFAHLSSSQKRRAQARQVRRGFTMIELLAVIAIIGTLAAMLFPVFAKAKGAAEKASCLANLKELTLAGLIYAQDHDDRYFPFGYWSGSDYQTWWGDLQTGDPKKSFLYPYTKSGQIRGCPAAVDLPNNAPYTFRMGYAINFRLFYAYPPESYAGERTVSGTEIERPAETVFGGDAATWDPFRHVPIGNPWLFGDSWNSHFHARHTGEVANVAWLDGHATSQHLYYHVAPLGQGGFVVEPDDLKACRLGDLLRFPIEDPQASVNGIRDQFYLLLQKPEGL